jgi:hypothetical protein
MKIEKPSRYFITFINIITIILFVGIITNYNKFTHCINEFIIQDLDNSYILTYGVLGIYILISLIAYKHSNLAGVLLFLILMIIIRVYLKSVIFIERFENGTTIKSTTTTTTNSDLTPTTTTQNTENEEIVNKVKDYLKEQVAENPNITNLEKEVIDDIYDTYFMNSDNLENLKRFNESASEYNPINNEQKVEDILNFYQ